MASNLAKTGQFEIATLCDCDSEMISVVLGKLKDLPRPPQTTGDFRRVLDDKDIDAVVVATPDHWHVLMTTLALDAGKHVYVEKPASYNINDGKAMVAAQQRHGRQTVLVGTTVQWTTFQRCQGACGLGVLGQVAFARAWIMLDRGSLPVVPDTEVPANLNYDRWLGPMHPYNEKCVHYNWHFMKDYGTGHG